MDKLEATVRESRKKLLDELLTRIAQFDPQTPVDANMILRAFAFAGPSEWCRVGPAPNTEEAITMGSYGYWLARELVDGRTPLQRRLPSTALVAAMSRAREMIFTCLLVRHRMFPWTPLEVWMQIFDYVNFSESSF